MTNIWEFILMTLTASLAAALLLAVKRLLADKLSPRWQYGIWVLLALRILLPVAVSGRYIILPLPLWIETLKTLAEEKLSSAFISAYEPISSAWFLPVINGRPQSITDWLFIIYIGGIIITLLTYAASYLRLRGLLSKGQEPAADTSAALDAVCLKYNLRPCRAVTIPGIASAFVCGIFRPVLVLPAGRETDEKVILHELLHLKHRDALQSTAWALLRALHWCNPFMHYIFNQIGNDMEALCDQRVLERLEGEERRDYGRILLSMANDRYARAFGTTSLSNGGRNIARRIQCIARFKKYPRGMALVSVCIAIILLQPLFAGTPAYGIQDSHSRSQGNSDAMLRSDLASARLNRCSTIAGAIDTYAKGIIFEDGLYIATASPLDKQEEIAAALKASKEDGWVYTHLENGLLGEPAYSYADVFGNGYYSVFNLLPAPDNTDIVTGKLIIYLGHYRHTEVEIASGMPVYYEDKETGEWLPAMAVYDITLLNEKNSWTVSDCSEPEIIIAETAQTPLNVYRAAGEINVFEGKGSHGTLKAPYRARYDIPVTSENNNSNWFWSGEPAISKTPALDAQFEQVDISFDVTYTFNGSSEDLSSIRYVTIENYICIEESDIPADAAEPLHSSSGAPTGIISSGSSSSGWSYEAEAFGDYPSGDSYGTWNGTITDRNCNMYLYYETDLFDIFSRKDTLPELPVPEALVSKVYIDGYDTEFIISRKEASHDQ